jgi:two-component system sensor histidine kinase AlgZ
MLFRSRTAIRILVLNFLLWTAVCGIGAMAQYTQDTNANYFWLLARWWKEYVPMMALSSALSGLMMHRSSLFEQRRHVLLLFGLVILLFQPAQWFYVAWLRGYLNDPGLSPSQVILKMRRFGWFMTAGTFAVVVAIANWRQARIRLRDWRRAQTDNLNLRLALEQQRVLTLRAQLEPHFMFNALNAISALVRSGDSTLALNGIGRLSDLLRYALSASARDEVTLGEELQFVNDYLSLQELRYGNRLRVHMEGDIGLTNDISCPPLLIQPLVENALRHDLDSHDGPSDICLHFDRQGDAMSIRVTNPLHAHASPNPGAGLGLANLRDRLRLMHPNTSLHAGPLGERFVAEVRLPLSGVD